MRKKPPSDPINPGHYKQGRVEVIQLTEHMSFCLGNVVKYCYRSGRKTPDPLQDLEKARWYLDREIQRLKPA